MTIDYQDVVFSLDFSRIEVVNGMRVLWDYGPNGLHFAFPGGAADPTPQLDGSLSFDGGDYLYLPASRMPKFYEKMPTRECTWFYRCSGDLSAGLAYQVVFSCWTAGGNNRGLMLNLTSGGVFNAYQFQGGAPQPRVVATRVVYANQSIVRAITVEGTPRSLQDQATDAVAWAGGAFGTCVYNTASVPRIADLEAGGQGFRGRQYYLSLIRGAVSSADLMFYSRLIAEGVRPWCVR